jgi:hypothetical protein
MYRIAVIGVCIGLVSCANPFPRSSCIEFEPIVYDRSDNEYTKEQITKHNANWLRKCSP